MRVTIETALTNDEIFHSLVAFITNNNIHRMMLFNLGELGQTEMVKIMRLYAYQPDLDLTILQEYTGQNLHDQTPSVFINPSCINVEGNTLITYTSNGNDEEKKMIDSVAQCYKKVDSSINDCVDLYIDEPIYHASYDQKRVESLEQEVYRIKKTFDQYEIILNRCKNFDFYVRVIRGMIEGFVIGSLGGLLLFLVFRFIVSMFMF